MRKACLFFVVLFAFVSIASGGFKKETARYDSNNLPEWIVVEWEKAQDELLELDNLKQDPRRFGPEQWEWIQFEEPFTDGELIRNQKGEWVRRTLLGVTRIEEKQILICCGEEETVRHEAFHAILWMMGDLERYEIHYPDFLKYIEELREKRK